MSMNILVAVAWHRPPIARWIKLLSDIGINYVWHGKEYPPVSWFKRTDPISGIFDPLKETPDFKSRSRQHNKQMKR